MERIQLIKDFFTAITGDIRIGPSHISLYTALVHLAELNQEANNEVYAFSYQIMPLAKLSSMSTFHRCIKDLVDFGYIKYIASYNHFVGSIFQLDVTHR